MLGRRFNMAGTIWADIVSGLALVLVAFITALSTRNGRQQKRRDEVYETRSALREEESRLSMKMMSAAIDLGVATALAVEQSKLNGEMKHAKEKAREAQAAYDAFLEKITAREVAK